MVDFACGPTLRSAEGKSIVTHLCVLIDDHDLLRAWGLRRAPFAADEKSRGIFAQASIDLLAEASDAIPRTLNLLAQSAWFIAARAHASSIEPDHVHQAIKNIPSAHDKIIHP
jgi:hypothetical protein